MTRKSLNNTRTGYTILLVDDNLEYLEATRILLERDGHTVVTSASGPDALDILAKQRIDLLLLDYYMPGMTGEQVVTELRKTNKVVQVILQTGYASEQPPRNLLQRLDIQGYFDKTEGPEKLLLWTEVGLKASFSIQMLTKSRQGLQYILDATPDLYKIQPLSNLLQGILWQIAGLLGVVDSFLAVLDKGGIHLSMKKETEGFLAILNDETELSIQASTGRFTGHSNVNEVVPKDRLPVIFDTIRNGTITVVNGTTVVPLKVGELNIGMIYLDRQVLQSQDTDLLQVFANQAAVAIQNSQLYEMATIDQLTGLYVRSFTEKWLYRELRTAFRSQTPLSFMMLDMDKLKRINDAAGHLVGDQALSTAGEILRRATRNTDIVGRYGGDEFAVILPQTGSQGAELVGQRILNSLKEKCMPSPEGNIYLSASLGLTVLEPNPLSNGNIPHPIPAAYFEEMGHLVIKNADEALYQSKSKGGGQIQGTSPLEWLPFA